MRTNQDMETLPQGVATFDPSGIQKAIEALVAQELLQIFSRALRDATTVREALQRVFQACAPLAALLGVPSGTLVSFLAAEMGPTATPAKVIAALQAALRKFG